MTPIGRQFGVTWIAVTPAVFPGHASLGRRRQDGRARIDETP
jgi:hypothetical protein